MNSHYNGYFKILELVPGAVLISDAYDHILFANSNAKKWFGKQVANEDMQWLFGKKNGVWQKLKSRVQSDGSASVDMEFRQYGITCINVQAINIPFQGQHCNVTFMRDISAQKLLEQELRAEKTMREYILDSIPALVFVKDDENRIISMNKAYREVTGLTMEQLANRNIIHAVENKELAEIFWKDDLEVIETGMPKRNIIEPLITDEKKWFITDKIPFRDERGKVIGVIGFSIDSTERKNAEDALMRSEKKLRLIFETSPDGIVMSDFEGNFLTTNEAFRNLLGYGHEDLSKLSFSDITPDHYPDQEKDFIKKAIHTNQDSETFEKEYIAKNNLLIPVSVTCWMLNDEVGKPLQMVANVKDLTYERKAEALEKSLLQKENEQLENDLKSKTQELNLKITQLIEKNQLVTSLIKQLQHMQKEHPGAIHKHIETIIHDLQNNTREDFWSQFETTFGQVNQSFYDNLFKAYPNLTNNERKISAFLKMNLSTKDIANITHQSIRSIEMARARLRAKLNLDRKENLSKFLNQF